MRIFTCCFKSPTSDDHTLEERGSSSQHSINGQHHAKTVTHSQETTALAKDYVRQKERAVQTFNAIAPHFTHKASPLVLGDGTQDSSSFFVPSTFPA